MGFNMRKKQLLGAWKLVLLTTLSLPLNAQSVSSETNSQEDQATAPAITGNPDADNAEDLPIDPQRVGRPSLDYVPSEAISEDRSVSFPVDI